MLSVSPAHVQLWFEQKPDPAVSMIDLTGPSGKVTIGTVHVMDDKSIMADISGALPPGTYKVAWQTAGDDGHVSKGEFSFMVHGHAQ